MVSFTLLGPVSATRSGHDLPLGSPAQRTVLATMLLFLGDNVTLALLAHGVWGDRVPSTARGLIRTYVSRLRGVLGPGVIETVGGGYRVSAEGLQLDLTGFADHVGTARTCRDRGDAAGVVAALRAALALWSGRPLGGTSEPFARRHVPRLDERRLEVLEWCLTEEVALGRHRDVVEELTAAVAEHPLREGLVKTCMTALYKCGRTAQAITTFHTTRQLLAGELGIDPSPELNACFEAVLRHHPVLVAGKEPGYVRRDVRLESRQLCGRDAHVQAQRVIDRTVTVIEGMPGVGKTALATELSCVLADGFPDGRLLLDLRGHRADQDPMTSWEALGCLLRAVGADPAPDTDVEQRAALWQAALAELSILVILDDGASTAQIRPLLPYGSCSRALVTSRNSLSLDHASTVVLGPLDLDAGVAMLADIVGAARISAEPRAADALVQVCGGLPLALRIAGIRLRQRPVWTVAHLVSRMADDSRRLMELRIDDQDVASAFATSYGVVEPSGRRMLQSLAEAPATVSFCAGTAAAAAGIDVERAEADLERLLDAHLLLQYEPDRYVLHELIQVYVRSASLRVAGRRPTVAAS